jgi:hypothetical protein
MFTKILSREENASRKFRQRPLSTFTDLSAEQMATLYDGRGGMEVDIKGDKRGLGIEKRRKKSFHAQEALVLLAQLSHNLLAYFKGWLLGGTGAEKLGVERLGLGRFWRCRPRRGWEGGGATSR